MPERQSMHCARCKVGWIVEIAFNEWPYFIESSPKARCWNCGERGAFGSVTAHCRRE